MIFRRSKVLVLFALFACASQAPKPQGSAADAPLQPPVARKVPHTFQLHGETLTDDYFWLRNKGTPEVEQYLRTEAAYADAKMKPTGPTSCGSWKRARGWIAAAARWPRGRWFR